MDSDRNLALQQVTYGPVKELLQGFLTCKEPGTLFTRGIGVNVPILTGRGCKFVHPAQPNGRPTLARVLLPVGGRPMVTILLFPSHPWGKGGGYIREDSSRTLAYVERRFISGQRPDDRVLDLDDLILTPMKTVDELAELYVRFLEDRDFPRKTG